MDKKTHQAVNPILEVETMVMEQTSTIYLNDGNEKNISKHESTLCDSIKVKGFIQTYIQVCGFNQFLKEIYVLWQL